MTTCLFCRIINRELPSQILYEDDTLIAIHDKFPKAPTHVLVMPKKHIPDLWDITPEDAGLMATLLAKLPVLAMALGLTQGFRTIVNTGKDSGQEIFHLHFHILGGKPSLPGF
jgi:histidine triad (HIT) family protein